MSSKHADVENQVLNVYRRVLPSVRAIEDPQIFEDYFSQRKNIFSLLQIHPWMIQGKRVLDIGGGHRGEFGYLFTTGGRSDPCGSQ